MQRQGSPAILALIIFAAAAIGCAAYAAATRQVSAYVMAGAILLLAAGQIAALIAHWSAARRSAESQFNSGRQLRSQTAEITALARRLDRLEAQLAVPAPDPTGDMLQEIRSLRDSFKSLVADLSVANADAAPVSEPPEATSAAAPLPAGERLELLLEPIIELATGATVHYRAQVNMTDDNGHAVPHGELMAKADEGGLRASLDAHLLELALPVLRRLRNKHVNMRMLVPLGAATLRGEPDLARLIALLEREHDVAGGVVFEIAQSDLAGLETAGIAGLARLGRLGATMALSGVSVAGLDLASLRQLGVRFLGIAAQSFDSGLGIASSWVEFSRFAKAMQFQIVAGGVATAAEASAATRIARFGSGAYFAPPRRVRSDAGRPLAASRIEAA